MMALASTSAVLLSFATAAAAVPEHLGNVTIRPGETLAGAVRRRLGAQRGPVTVPLHGGVSDVGQFYIEVELGKKGERLTAQVDTGSSTIAFPALGCRQVDQARACNDLNFYSAASADNVRCGDRNCKFSLSYVDGSGAEGQLVKDKLKLNGVKGLPLDASITFGAISEETGLFQEFPEINGIIGMAGGGGALQGEGSLIGQLVAQGVLHDQFGMCFGQGGGTLVMGGVDDTAFTGGLTYVKMLPGPDYQIMVDSVGFRSNAAPKGDSETCADDMEWKDADGDGCDKYSSKTCRRADIDQFTAGGRNALDACMYTCGTCLRLVESFARASAEDVEIDGAPALVDSGTTKLIITRPMFEAFEQHIRVSCIPAKVCVSANGMVDPLCEEFISKMLEHVASANCFPLNHRLKNACFPVIDFKVRTADGVMKTLSLNPDQYVYVLIDHGRSYHCPAVKQHDGGITLGDAFMQAHYTDFDRESDQLGFAPAVTDKCGGNTQCANMNSNCNKCSMSSACFWCAQKSECVSASDLCSHGACSNHLQRPGSRCDCDGDGVLAPHVGKDAKFEHINALQQAAQSAKAADGTRAHVHVNKSDKTHVFNGGAKHALGAVTGTGGGAKKKHHKKHGGGGVDVMHHEMQGANDLPPSGKDKTTAAAHPHKKHHLKQAAPSISGEVGMNTLEHDQEELSINQKEATLSLSSKAATASKTYDVEEIGMPKLPGRDTRHHNGGGRDVHNRRKNKAKFEIFPDLPITSKGEETPSEKRLAQEMLQYAAQSSKLSAGDHDLSSSKKSPGVAMKALALPGHDDMKGHGHFDIHPEHMDFEARSAYMKAKAETLSNAEKTEVFPGMGESEKRHAEEKQVPGGRWDIFGRFHKELAEGEWDIHGIFHPARNDSGLATSYKMAAAEAGGAAGAGLGSSVWLSIGATAGVVAVAAALVAARHGRKAPTGERAVLLNQ